MYNLKYLTSIIPLLHNIVLFFFNASGVHIVMTDPVTTPPSKPKPDDGRPDIATLLFPASPDSAGTARLPSLMQHEHDESRATKSRRILNISDVTHIHLRCCIQKIYEMSTDVIKGYGTFYYDKYGKPSYR